MIAASDDFVPAPKPAYLNGPSLFVTTRRSVANMCGHFAVASRARRPTNARPHGLPARDGEPRAGSSR